jgi:hypothetical protein
VRVRTTPLVAIIGLPACVAPATDAVDRGYLRIREQRTASGSIPIEGAYQYISVRRTSDNRVVYRDRSSTRLSASLHLRPGFYRVSSWTRTCSGTCATLDPPSDRCRGAFRVRSKRYITATIHTAFGERCRITNP